MKLHGKFSKTIARLVIISSLVVITVVLGRIIDHEIGIRMDRLKTEIITYIENQLERKISYESISPSIFMFLEVRELKIYTSRSGDDELFHIKTLRIMYNLISLVTERDPLRCVTEINISNTLFSLDLGNGNPQLRSELQNDLLTKLASSKYLFKVTGSKVELAIDSAPYTVDLTNIFFELSAKDNTFYFDLRRGKLNLVRNGNNAPESWISTNLKMKGSFDPLLRHADFMLTATNASSNFFELAKQTFHITLSDDIVKLTKTEDKIPLDVSLVYDISGRKLEIDFKTERFTPLSAIKLTGPLHSLNDWLDFSTSSRGKLSYSADTNSLEYALSADIKVIKNPILPEGLHVTSSLRGNKDEIFFEPLVIHTIKGGIYFNGNVIFAKYFPEGFLNVVNVQLIPGRDLSGSFSLDRTETGMSVNGASLTVGDMGLYDINLALHLKPKSIDFTLACLLDRKDPGKKLGLAGSLETVPAFSLGFKGECEGIPVSNAYKFITPDKDYSEAISAMFDNYRVSFDFAFSSNLRDTEFKTERLAITDILNPKNKAILSLGATPRDFAMNIVSLEWEKYKVTGKSGFSFAGDGRVSFEISLIVEDIPYEIKGSYSPGSGLLVSGSYDLFASYISRKGNDSVMTARVTKLPFPVLPSKTKIFYVSFDMNGLFKNETDWRVICPRFTVYDVPLFGPANNTIDASFTLSQDKLFFSKIKYKDSISEVEGDGNIYYNSFDFRNSRIELASEKTNEKYVVTINSIFKSVDVKLDFENFPLERLGKFVITGSLAGNIAVRGNLVDAETEMNVSLVKGAFNGDRVAFKMRAIVGRDRITFPAISGSYIDQKIDNGTGFFDLRNGGFNVNARYSSGLFNKEISSAIAFEGGFRQLPGDFGLDDSLARDFVSRLSFSDIKVDNKEYPPWSINLNRAGTTYTITGGPEDVLNGSISSTNGLFDLEVSQPFPIRASAHGVIDGNKINSVIDHIWMDASVMNVLLGEDVTKFTAGEVSGIDLTIKGLVNDPDFFGTLGAKGVKLGFFLSPGETEPFDTDFEFKEKTFSMKQVEVAVENGKIATDYAYFYMDHWLPNRFEMSFHSDYLVGLHTVYDFGAINVDGYAIGTIKAQGDQRLIRINGNLDVSFCKIMLGNNNVKKSNTANKNAPDLEIALEFKTRKKVEFYWPSFGFPVLTCVAKPQSKLALSFSTETNQFSLKGVVDILRGEVFFFNRNFHIQEGNISFNVSDPVDFDPRISLRADIKELDENSEDVDIYFIAENNRLSELRPRFESVPIRTEAEIFALLGGSIQQKFDSEKFGVSMVLFSSEVLSQFGFFITFEQAIRKIFNLDLFSIRTQLLRNLLAQGIEPQQTTPTTPATLGKYLDDTTITFGRYIGESLFLMGLVHLKDITDPTQTALNNGFFGVEPQFELALQWPTPFFNLEWSFAPKGEHMQDLFLPDTKISFEWHYSY